MSSDDNFDLEDDDEDFSDLYEEDDDDDDSQKSSGRSGKGLYIILILAFLFLIVAGGGVYYFYNLWKIEELSFIPEEAQIVGKIQIDPGVRKMIFTKEYGKIHDNPDTEKRVYDFLNRLMIGLFFRESFSDINITKDFLEYVDPEMAVGGFNIGLNLAKKLPYNLLKTDIKSDNINTVGAFRINNKEKVDEFFKKVQYRYVAAEKEVKGYRIFVSNSLSYAFYRNFVIISTSPDTLVLSLETVRKKHKSILNQEKFQLYREKLSGDTIGFVYVNLAYLREDFCNTAKIQEDSNLIQFIKSIKILGTGVAFSEKGISVENLMIPEENISNPVAIKYFSQTPKEPLSLKFFPEDNTTNLMVLTNIAELYEVYAGLTEDFMPGLKQNMKNLVEARLGLNLERDILASLTGEIAVSYPVKSAAEVGLALFLNPQQLIEGFAVMLGIRKDSRLESLIAGADSLMSLVAPPPKFKGVGIVSAPDKSISYAYTENFVMLSMGKAHKRIEELITTQQDKIPSLYDLYKERKLPFPRQVLGISFINIKLLYRGLGVDSNTEKTLQRVPEIWIVNTKEDHGIKTTVYVPFIL